MAKRSYTPPKGGYPEPQHYVSPPLDVPFATKGHRYYRADLEIFGIYHGEASFEGRVFLNNVKANSKTPMTSQSGYAGSFHIFGHGGCLGDPGHCEINDQKRDQFDVRTPHPLTPADKRVTITDALRSVTVKSAKVRVVIVPVVTAATEQCNLKEVLKFESLRVVTYN